MPDPSRLTPTRFAVSRQPLRSMANALATLSLFSVALTGDTPYTVGAFLLVLAYVILAEYRAHAAQPVESPALARLREAGSLQALCSCVLANPPEPQFHSRVPTAPSTALTIIESGTEVPLTVIDFAETGMCAFVSEALPVASPVRIVRGTRAFHGTLRYCLRVESAFAIGVKFHLVARQPGEFDGSPTPEWLHR